MRITIRFFAILKDAAGTDQISLQLDDRSDVAQAADQLRKQLPSLEKHLPRIAYAVNREYVPKDHVLKEGDELALIPPVSGG